MEDEFEQFKARAYGSTFENNQHTETSKASYQQNHQQQSDPPHIHQQQSLYQQIYNQKSPYPQNHHAKKSKSKHPRRSRLKAAATEATPSSSCSDKVAEDVKKRRHSALGVADLSQRRNILPSINFLPLDEEGVVEGVTQTRRRSEQNSLGAKGEVEKEDVENVHSIHLQQHLQQNEQHPQQGYYNPQQLSQQRHYNPQQRQYNPQQRQHNPQQRQHNPQQRQHNPQQRKYNPQQLQRQAQIDDSANEDAFPRQDFRMNKVTFVESEGSSRCKGGLREMEGSEGSKVLHGEEREEEDVGRRRLSCDNVLSSRQEHSSKQDNWHKRRYSAKDRNVHATSGSLKRGNEERQESINIENSSKNLNKISFIKFKEGGDGDDNSDASKLRFGSGNVGVKSRSNKSIFQASTQHSQLNPSASARLRRSSMFVLPESSAHSSNYNLSSHRTPTKNSILSVSPTTLRRNSTSKSKLSPPISFLNNTSGGRRNSAITYLTDVSPSKSKASLTSMGYGEDGWKHKEALATSPAEEDEEEEDEVIAVKILVVGANGVGKTTLMSQLLTSEYLANKNASDPDLTSTLQSSATVFLDGDSYLVTFLEWPCVNDDQLDDTDACVVTYAVNDRPSYLQAQASVEAVRQRFATKRMFVVMVANKEDLVRNRVVPMKEGKKFSSAKQCHYLEVSALLDHRVDKLLACVIKGVRVRRDKVTLGGVEDNGEGSNDDIDEEEEDDDADEEDDDEMKKSKGKNCLSSFVRSIVDCFS